MALISTHIEKSTEITMTTRRSMASLFPGPSVNQPSRKSWTLKDVILLFLVVYSHPRPSSVFRLPPPASQLPHTQLPHTTPSHTIYSHTNYSHSHLLGIVIANFVAECIFRALPLTFQITPDRNGSVKRPDKVS